MRQALRSGRPADCMIPFSKFSPSLLVLISGVWADPAEQVFRNEVKPLIENYCLNCHSTGEQEGELDLERFGSLADVLAEPEIWEQVAEQFVLEEMPPRKEEQPSAEEMAVLQGWVGDVLKEIGRRRAGDPGPVVVRRLSNSEYTYTLRDLTGIESLDPAAEFPVDGAAGEGFTNAGAALVMSPAYFTKYLDAAKKVSNHLVLLPDGFAFSEATSRRDLTEEKLTEIRDFYGRYSVQGSGTAVDLQGVRFETNRGGVIPLEAYFRATLEAREELQAESVSLAEVAKRSGLNEKYLERLWKSLHDSEVGFPLESIQATWREASAEGAKALAGKVSKWQQSLWHFRSIGDTGGIGSRGGKWQEAKDPIVESQELSRPVPELTAGREEVRISLVASDAGDGSDHDIVRWENPRLVREGRSDIPLYDVVGLVEELERRQVKELARTRTYLSAVLGNEAGLDSLDADLLTRWRTLLGISKPGPPEISGYLKERQSKVAGYDEVRGWGGAAPPVLLANRGTEELSFSTLKLPGRAVTVHPSPSQEARVYWRSPIDGEVALSGMLADQDGNCGNGIAWRLTHLSGTIDLKKKESESEILRGNLDNGGRHEFASKQAILVKKGDLILLGVDPRDGDYSCDTTQIALVLTERDGERRRWDLAEELAERVHEGNPLADRYANPDVWHFCAAGQDEQSSPVIVPGSLLSRWLSAVEEGAKSEEIESLSAAVETLLAGHQVPANTSEADRAMYQILRGWDGPLGWLETALTRQKKSRDFEVRAPSSLDFKLPARLAKGVTVKTRARILNGDASAQVRILFDTDGAIHSETDLVAGLPVLVSKEGAVSEKIRTGFESFRAVFPAALCYTKIVPVDQVVTLTLHYREDGALQDLFLNEAEIAELDTLWEQLRFVSQSPFQLEDAYEQMREFVTQDGGDDSRLDSLREPISEDARKLRDEMEQAIPAQIDAMVAFAGKAWRRSLGTKEQESMRGFYQKLRTEELAHGDALRLMLARILTSPTFLYKNEKPGEGTKSGPVSEVELATRLSYFLWSSLPDAELMTVAEAGALRKPDTLRGQVRRMLRDSRMRRMAAEFASQWLHVRNFDELDEKSEQHFPEFAAIRADLNEEPIRFFTDWFQRNGTVRELLDADHTFVNPTLANYYGFESIEGEGWRRVDGVREKGRGGVLGFGATLARQSGASRTSAILRGTWVIESLLGEHIPPPPKGTPVLPQELPTGLSERETTERHVSDEGCARCHVRIDPFGFSLEHYDAIGRFREVDFAGRAINATAKTRHGEEFEGLEGLREYLLKERGDDFSRQFCRKLLGYALGREVLLGDGPLLDEMVGHSPAGNLHIEVLIEMIVSSPQFLEIRGIKNTSKH